MQTSLQDPSRHRPEVLVIGETDADKREARTAWRIFDVECCECFDSTDKARIMSVINSQVSGCSAFNDYIRSLAEQIFEDVEGDMDVVLQHVNLALNDYSIVVSDQGVLSALVELPVDTECRI